MPFNLGTCYKIGDSTMCLPSWKFWGISSFSFCQRSLKKWRPRILKSSLSRHRQQMINKESKKLCHRVFFSMFHLGSFNMNAGNKLSKKNFSSCITYKFWLPRNSNSDPFQYDRDKYSSIKCFKEGVRWSN